ncbi:MAG: methyltransferase domain-containing protein [Parcubacteria group bacterium]|nr:methyltransferase domain-containing protein [Parcubacteria group bacterium]
MSNSDKFKQIEFEEIKECPFCSSEQIKFLFSAPERLTDLPGIFSVYQCQECGLAFQNPLVREEYIGLYYTERLGYYSPSANKDKEPHGLKKFLTEHILVNHLKYDFKKKNIFLLFLTLPLKRFLKTRIFPDFKQGGKFLDIGCAGGRLLSRMKKMGWDTTGIEMHKKTANYAQEQLGLKVFNKRIEDADFPEQEFDAIVMSMVLEHLYHPFMSLEKITKWLKKDGQLIFSIPYFNGFEFNRFRGYSFGLQLPIHITFLSKKVIKQHLTTLGYKDIKFYHQFFDRDIIASARNKYKDTGVWFYKILGHNKIVRILLVRPFVFLLALFNKTSRITVYAKKI